MKIGRWRGLGLVLLYGALGLCQEKPSPRPTFDVASIRLSQPDTNGGIKALPGGNGYTAHNVQVKLMISLMYRIPMRQIKGGPEWLNTDKYDVEARADGAYDIDELHVMYQNLLADRLGLKFHIEAKEGPVYLLTVDKGGPKMTINETPQDFKVPINFADHGVVGKRVRMDYFSWFLGQQLQRSERPVVNKTGLTGCYDFTLTFQPDFGPDFPRETLPPEMLNRPTLFDAVREQLGLKLTAEKGPVEYFVIDSIARPTDN
jgi:uncharacterized protein (TIGR03435 family)